MVSENKKKYIFGILIVVILTAIVYSFYSIYFKKDLDFIVEFPCDTSKEICTIRNCSNEYDCPPNGLSSFTRYIIKGKDFAVCDKSGDCISFCERDESSCVKLDCEENEEYGESCYSEIPAISFNLHNLKDNNFYINN